MPPWEPVRLDAETFEELIERGHAPGRISLLRHAGELAARLRCRAYLVGGPVRDLLLRRPHLDVDLVVEGDGPGFAVALAQALGAQVTVHEHFFTAALALPDCGGSIDIATARSEVYEQPGALPKVRPASLVDDLRRRDFTVNAMAMSLAPSDFGRLVDPYAGRQDLGAGLLRVLHPGSFRDDPTRIIRGVGFQVRLGLSFEPATAALLTEAVRGRALHTVSPHRLGEALLPLLANGCGGALLRAADELGLLSNLGLVAGRLTDEQQRAVAAAPVAFAALDLPERGQTTALTYLALLATGDVVAARFACSALHLSRRLETELVRATDLLAAPPEELDDPCVGNSRLFFALVEANAPGAAALWASAPQGPRRRNLERYWRCLRTARADLTGLDLIAAGARPGPHFAAALRAALALRLDDAAANRSAQLAAALNALDMQTERHDAL
jgi:tRNA nucleotidyltransferase (CCA-adding enzyme)